MPFIFVSGAISETAAFEALHPGATDSVFKHQLQQLGPALARALGEVREQRSLRESEANYHFETEERLIKRWGYDTAERGDASAHIH